MRGKARVRRNADARAVSVARCRRYVARALRGASARCGARHQPRRVDRIRPACVRRPDAIHRTVGTHRRTRDTETIGHRLPVGRARGTSSSGVKGTARSRWHCGDRRSATTSRRLGRSCFPATLQLVVLWSLASSRLASRRGCPKRSTGGLALRVVIKPRGTLGAFEEWPECVLAVKREVFLRRSATRRRRSCRGRRARSRRRLAVASRSLALDSSPSAHATRRVCPTYSASDA